MGSRSGRLVVLAWYGRQNYPAVRGIMEDADKLPVDYDAWLRQAQSVLRLEVALGSDIVKVTIDPDAFATWCRATGQRTDARARARYAKGAIELEHDLV